MDLYLFITNFRVINYGKYPRYKARWLRNTPSRDSEKLVEDDIQTTFYKDALELVSCLLIKINYDTDSQEPMIIMIIPSRKCTESGTLNKKSFDLGNKRKLD